MRQSKHDLETTIAFGSELCCICEQIFVLVILLLVDFHDRCIGHLKGMWRHHFFICTAVFVSGTLESFDAYSELSSVPLLHVAMASIVRRRRSHSSVSSPTKILYSLSRQYVVSLTHTHGCLLFSRTAYEVAEHVCMPRALHSMSQRLFSQLPLSLRCTPCV